MAKFRPAIVSLAGGEWTDLLTERTDLAKYPVSAQLIENFMPRVQGVSTFDPGTRFVAELKSSALRGRLAPFIYSTEQAYVFELGDQIMRFFRNKQPIALPTASATIAGDDSSFTAGIGTWADDSTGAAAIGHDAALGALKLDPGATPGDIAKASLAIATGSVGVPHVIRFRTVKPQWRADTPIVFSAPVNTSFQPRDILLEGWHAVTVTPQASPFEIQFALVAPATGDDFFAWIDDVSVHAAGPLELPTPWAAADLPRLKWRQSRDVIWFFHPNYPTYKAERRSNTDWSLVRVVWIDGPFGPVNTTGTTLAAAAGTGNAVALTASAAIGINGGRGFQATDLRRAVRLKKSGGNWSWGIITAVASPTAATVQIVDAGDFGTVGVVDWRLGRFHDGAGFAGCAAFFKQRFFLGGQRDDNQRLLGSLPGRFETFSPSEPNGTVADDSALDYALDDDEANAIRWLAPLLALLAGTGSAQWRIGQPNGAAALTPTNRDAAPQVRLGAADISPVAINNSILYVGVSRTDLYELRYELGADAFVAEERMIFAEHVGEAGIAEIAWQQSPWRVLWAVRDNGELAGMTYLREQGFDGWHRHPDLNGFVESIAVIPADPGGASANRDQLWLQVRREVAGQTHRYVEVMEDPLPRPGPGPIGPGGVGQGAGRRDDAWHVRSALMLDNRIEAVLTVGSGAMGAGTSNVVFARAPGSFTSGDIGKEIHFDWIDRTRRANQPGYLRKGVARITGIAGADALCQIAGAFPSLASVAAGAWRLTATTISGLDHLEGLAVTGVVDGEALAPQVVTSGAIALGLPGASKAIVGLGYLGRLVPMPLEAVVQSGTTAGTPKHVSGATLSLFRSLGGRVGRLESEEQPALTYPVEYRRAGSDAAAPLDLFTGRQKTGVTFGQEDPCNLLIEQHLPLPFTLRAIYPELKA